MDDHRVMTTGDHMATQVAPGIEIRFNPQQEHKSQRWEVSHDYGVDGFPTRYIARAFADALIENNNEAWVNEQRAHREAHGY
jgi:hypothetical protein